MQEKLTLVKTGGRILDDEAELNKFLADFASIKGKKILVHGGGVVITELCDKLDIKTQMVDGRRITSEANMEVVLMSCAGKLSKYLVANLNKLGMNAVGLCGGDLSIISSRKRQAVPVDYGMVGDVEKVDTKWLNIFVENGAVPVVSSISQSKQFELLNTNADTIAANVAAAMAEHYSVDLYFYFDKVGVLKDSNNDDSLISELHVNDFDKMIQDKTIHTGMLPKLKNGFLAKKLGVKEVKLGNEIGAGTLLLI